MPELPEVETVVRGLRPLLVGRTIRSVSSHAPKAVLEVGKSFGKQSFASALRGQTVESITRRGKNILINFKSGATLWVHLKMTGQFRHVHASEPIGKHDLVIVTLEEETVNDRQIRYNDYRRFGRLRLLTPDELREAEQIRTLGPEPFDLTASAFVQRAKHRSRQLKAALLDQSFIAGVGNIYADEALYAARLHPRKLTSRTSPEKLAALHASLTEILSFAIDHMGSSVDSYVGVNGEGGSFQNYLKAYGREGEPCGRCGSAIRREKIGQRSAHYCPRCQRV